MIVQPKCRQNTPRPFEIPLGEDSCNVRRLRPVVGLFKAFVSTKVIFRDATLFTQRLWFAPVFHPNRHVLGWFRLVRDLQSAGVSPICVFDGKERNIAKSREVRLGPVPPSSYEQ